MNKMKEKVIQIAIGENYQLYALTNRGRIFMLENGTMPLSGSLPRLPRWFEVVKTLKC